MAQGAREARVDDSGRDGLRSDDTAVEVVEAVRRVLANPGRTRR